MNMTTKNQLPTDSTETKDFSLSNIYKPSDDKNNAYSDPRAPSFTQVKLGAAMKTPHCARASE